MTRKNVALVQLVVLGVVVATASFAAGTIHFSDYDGGQQMWLTSDSFVARSTTAVPGTPDFVSDPAAPGKISGRPESSFYFPKDSPNGVQDDWWVEYQIPKSAIPASFNITGTWTFWGRVSQSQEQSSESDWLVVNGDPTDLDKPNPTDADWYAGLNRSTAAERVFNLSNPQPPDKRPPYFWYWNSGEKAMSPDIDPTTLRTKELKLVNDMVSFRLYEREAASTNARVDLIVWANDRAFRPSDWRWMLIPEPGSFLALATSIVGLGAFGRRRGS